MKILTIISSGRKNGHTSKITSLLEEKIKEIAVNYTDFLQFETLFLTNYKIEHCKGCRTCIDYGEDKCPIKDDVPLIKNQMKESDAVIFATPVYVGDVNSIMKALIDRLAYICHRQEFYDKLALIIVTTNVTSIKRTIHTIGAATYSWGFKTIGIKGFKTSTSNDPKEILKQKYCKVISKLAKKLYSAMKEKSYLNPSILSLAIFKIQQKSRGNLDLSNEIDYKYWKENGWIDKKRQYYFDVKVSLLRRIFSMIIYGIISIVAKT
ncbi:MAG: flavodoxin family protein [Candidatus Thorarchaeota archaeon]